MKKGLALLTLLLVSLVSANAVWAANTADVVFVVDESGSMSGEHAWLADMVEDLEAALISAGITNNQYALIGFGDSDVYPNNVSSGWTTASGLATATNDLVLSGGTEDGYDGIAYAFDELTFRTNAAVNVILITDEDRDIFDVNDTYAVIESLFGDSEILNAVVNAYFTDGTTTSNVIGVDSEGNAYTADGTGGYTTTEGTGDYSSGYYTTEEDYIDLAWATGGAAWNLNLLRAGGTTAESFTKAFIDIKVKEIQETPVAESPVPEPATALLFGLGILGLAGIGRKKHMA